MRRRELLGSAAALGLLAVCSPPGVPGAKAALADGPLETKTIRLTKLPSICLAPQYMAEDLLRAQGFTDVQYVTGVTADVQGLMTSGQVDMSTNFGAPYVTMVDQGAPIVRRGGRDQEHTRTDHRGCDRSAVPRQAQEGAALAA